MGTTSAPARLSSEQIAFYRTEGYLKVADPVLSQGKFDALKTHFEQKLARLADDVRPETMDAPHYTDPRLFEWLFADEVLDLVEPIIGPDIALFASHFICKPRGNGKRVPWHEDSFYWKGKLTPMEVCTLWLAIDPSTRINGCMKVIPRSLHGYSEYEPVDTAKNVFPTEIKKNMVDESRAVYLELDPNHGSLHDGRLMHGSDPNNSSIRRCGYTMRYISTRVKLSEAAQSRDLIYLARGKDYSGNQYADPTKSYEALARFREKSGGAGH